MSRVTPYGPLRRACGDDLPRLLELEGMLFDNSMNETMLERELALGQCFVYDVMGEVLGYALLRDDGHQYDLTRLGVDPKSQRGGIGRVLLKHVVSRQKEELRGPTALPQTRLRNRSPAQRARGVGAATRLFGGRCAGSGRVAGRVAGW
jgi:ribosomal protein S18 acetylase RimI-like enzyme